MRNPDDEFNDGIVPDSSPEQEEHNIWIEEQDIDALMGKVLSLADSMGIQRVETPADSDDESESDEDEDGEKSFSLTKDSSVVAKSSVSPITLSAYDRIFSKSAGGRSTGFSVGGFFGKDSSCGAGAPGDPGFQIGNDCAENRGSAHRDAGVPDTVSFVSPNIGESSGSVDADVDRAMREIDGARHSQIRSISEDVDRQLGLPVESSNAVGVWSDGAENSLVLSDGDIDYDTWRYATAVKAMHAQQKDAIVFKSDPQGGSLLYMAHIDGSTKDIPRLRKQASDAGLQYHTIEDRGADGLTVIVFDPSGSGDLNGPMKTFAESSNAVRVESKRGRGEFITNEWQYRSKALREYRRVISEYEKKYPDRRHYRRGSIRPGGDGGTEPVTKASRRKVTGGSSLVSLADIMWDSETRSWVR